MRRPYGASRTAGHATGRAAGNITSGAAAAPQRDGPRPMAGTENRKSRRYSLRPLALSGVKTNKPKTDRPEWAHKKPAERQTMRRPYGASRAAGRAAGNITSGAAAAPQRDEPRPMAADEGHIAGRQRPERTHCGGRTPFAGSFLKKVVKERKTA